MPGLLAWAAAPVQGRNAEAERQSRAASGRWPSWERCSAPSIPTSPQRGRTTRLCCEWPTAMPQWHPLRHDG